MSKKPFGFLLIVGLFSSSLAFAGPSKNDLYEPYRVKVPLDRKMSNKEEKAEEIRQRKKIQEVLAKVAARDCAKVNQKNKSGKSARKIAVR